MTGFSAGVLVRHASLGVGKVVAVEPSAVHVFFPAGGKRYAAKLHLPTVGALLSRDGVVPDPWLEGLTSFSLDPITNRWALGATFVGLEQARADFLAAHPDAFTATPGARDRAARWRAASAEWTASLGGGQAEKLLAAGDVKELVKRTVKLEPHLLQVPGTFEAGMLAEAFRDEDGAGVFFEALLGLLSVPSPSRARFDGLFAATGTLEVDPATAWPIATVFPFLVEPGKQVFLSRRHACGAAERLGCDLRFDPTPNWATYSALRTLSTRVLEELRPAGARDHCDVETFLYATATGRDRAAAVRAAARKPAAAKTARRATASKR